MINNAPKPKIGGDEVNVLSLIPKLFDKGKLIGVCADVDQGKSNLIYAIINELKTKWMFNENNLYSYALPVWVGEQKIKSVEELELIQNSVIILDEFFMFLDLDDRKKVKQLAAMMQRVKHANNVVIMCGLPFNFNKFISSQLEIKIYKQTTLKNLINGSPMKDVITSYTGSEKGSSILRLDKNQALVYGIKNEKTGIPHYQIANVPHMKEYDVKRLLQPILVSR